LRRSVRGSFSCFGPELRLRGAEHPGQLTPRQAGRLLLTPRRDIVDQVAVLSQILWKPWCLYGLLHELISS
jgi:hypothetical protein